MHIHLICSSRQAAGWQAALRASPRGFHVTVCQPPLQDALRSLQQALPDILVIQVTQDTDFRDLLDFAQNQPELDCVLVGTQPDAETLLELMRSGVREVLPGEPTGPALSQAVERLARKRGGQSHPARRAKVLCFMSCKGGSGATFLATNLAVALSRHGERKVALLDFNLQFGDALLFISSERARSHVAEVAANSERLDADLLRASMLEVSPGLHVLASPEDPALSEDITAEHIRAIVQTAQTAFDYVVIDLGRTLNAVNLQVLDMADKVYAVLQLTLPFIRDGKRLRDVFNSLDYPPGKVSWIVNRFERGGQLTLSDVKHSLHAEDIITVPNHYSVVADSVNQGIPVADIAPHSPVTEALAHLADHIVQGDTDTPTHTGLRGLLDKLFDQHDKGAT